MNWFVTLRLYTVFYRFDKPNVPVIAIQIVVMNFIISKYVIEPYSMMSKREQQRNEWMKNEYRNERMNEWIFYILKVIIYYTTLKQSILLRL